MPYHQSGSAGRKVWLSAAPAPPHLLRVPAAWREHLAWASLQSDPVRCQAGGAPSVEPWAQRLGLAQPLGPAVLGYVSPASTRLQPISRYLSGATP